MRDRSRLIEAGPSRQKAKSRFCAAAAVSSDYFKAMVSVAAGRGFHRRRSLQGHDSSLSMRPLLGRFFSGEDPIGKRIKVGAYNPPYSTIVGVVANHHISRVWTTGFGRDVYPYVNTADPPLSQMNLVVKTKVIRRA